MSKPIGTTFVYLQLLSSQHISAAVMKKYGKRFMLGWIFSSIVMFALSYLWHGVVLNDYELIRYPLGIYLVSAGVVYLVIGFLLNRIFIAEFLDRFSQKAMPRAILTGIGLGLIVYMVALVVGVAFTKSLELKYMALDVLWQTIEQCVGGLVVGLVYVLVFEFIPQPLEEENNAQ
jgi:hypothetical protein